MNAKTDIAPKSTPVFWNEVGAGRLVPKRFNSFWPEAGAMSSGGPHNQLELPRSWNLFFRYSHGHYNSEQELIGEPVLITGNSKWRDRRLTWHGNNAMDRINLRTASQGGFIYQVTAILFTLTSDGLQMTAEPWNSEIAKEWQRIPLGSQAVYRLGVRGNRVLRTFQKHDHI